MYDALHPEITRQLDGAVEGLLVHVARPTADGFQVLEVWESRSHFDRYNDEIVLPTMARMAAGRPGPAPQQTVQEFEVRGLVLAEGKVLV